MTLAVAGYGTLLKRGAVTIAEVKDISGPGLSMDTIDVTHHSSPAAWREKIAGLLDAGEITLEINFLPADVTHKDVAAGLVNDLKIRTATTYSITFIGGTVWSAPCLVTKFEPNAPVEDELSASVTLTITGAPTLA